MRRSLVITGIFALILVISSSIVFASTIEAESRIASVTVYPDSALISRKASPKLSPGAHTVVFSDIIPEIDENSLRVSAEGNAEVKLLGAQVKKEFLQEEAAEEVKRLQEEIQKLQDEARKIEDQKKVLSEEKQFLDSIRLYSGQQIPKDLITKMPAVKDLEDTLNFLANRLKAIYSQLIEAELQIREIQKKAEVLRRQLAEISGPRRKMKRSIIVELEALKSGNLDLTVSYLVRGAWWQPIYDARADFVGSKVEMVSYGIISQTTGEDWPEVEISLSTAKPAIGGSMPYVAPWILRPYQPPRIMKEKVQRSGMVRQTMAFDKDAAMVEEEGRGIGGSPETLASVEERGIAVIYKLPNKATIKSDGSEYKLPVSSQMLAAEFQYSSYPRAVLLAYLGSRVTNAKDLQLLGGRVNIFLEGDFVGASAIDNIGPGEEFDLYLGADENVKVKREQIEKKIDETLIAGIPAPTKRTTYKYKLTAENYKSKKINVKLFEAMPIPEDDRIKVKMVSMSLEPSQKDWKDRKGIWLWELELEPRGKKEIIYTYIVEHPREMQVEGLSSPGAMTRYSSQVEAF
jgi:uncharacterized protein (TIGR02231 family)